MTNCFLFITILCNSNACLKGLSVGILLLYYSGIIQRRSVLYSSKCSTIGVSLVRLSSPFPSLFLPGRGVGVVFSKHGRVNQQSM
ncbi:hypothetical protein VNO78_11319 [Psophocarpus tetragonolobus]|uniref:Uncharacterized protein n=1 Tax=Psophocarpus tetragonolobus TaxID=3891 RepID=A0AAN9XNI0_PSOTE